MLIVLVINVVFNINNAYVGIPLFAILAERLLRCSAIN